MRERRSGEFAGSHLVAALLVAALLLTGCGQSDGGPSDNGAQALDERSPHEVLGLGAGGQLIAQLQYEEAVAREKAIEQCMADLGQHYSPLTVPEPVNLATGYEPGSADYARAHGYGGLTSFAEHEVAALEQDLERSAALAAMGEQQARAWVAALVGGGPADAAILLGRARNNEPIQDLIERYDRGCVGVAASAGSLDNIWPVLNDNEAAFREWETRRRSDERVIDLEQRWVECMQEAGFGDVDAPFEASQPFSELYADIRESLEVAPDGTVNFDREALATGIESEIATASSDAECEEPLAEERASIQRSLNMTFWSDNPDLYATLSAAAID